MNIVFLDSKTIGEPDNLRAIERLGTVRWYETTTADELASRIKDQEIVITNKVVIDRRAIDEAARLRLICVAATGTDNVDVAYARQRGIAVKNVKGYSTPSELHHTRRGVAHRGQEREGLLHAECGATHLVYDFELAPATAALQPLCAFGSLRAARRVH